MYNSNVFSRSEENELITYKSKFWKLQNTKLTHKKSFCIHKIRVLPINGRICFDRKSISEGKALLGFLSLYFQIKIPISRDVHVYESYVFLLCLTFALTFKVAFCCVLFLLHSKCG